MPSSYVIMDEADRMVDLGFEIDLNLILDSMPATSLQPEEELSAKSDVSQLRVTSLYSATMPIQVERIARKYLRKPATITIGDAGEAAQTVQQIVEFIASDEKKKARLIDILRNGGFAAPIVSPPFITCTALTKYRSSSSIRSVLPMLL
jgi:ATP-dependent RNA helicase DDX23/PRP28